MGGGESSLPLSIIYCFVSVCVFQRCILQRDRMPAKRLSGVPDCSLLDQPAIRPAIQNPV